VISSGELAMETAQELKRRLDRVGETLDQLRGYL